MAEPPDDRQLRLRLEAECAKLARELKGRMPPGAGFALFLCDLGAGGSFAYASSVDRQDMRRLTVEFLHKTGGLPEAISELLIEQVTSMRSGAAELAASRGQADLAEAIAELRLVGVDRVDVPKGVG